MPSDLTGPVSHDEAVQILSRFNNGHWKREDGPRYSIPTNPSRDDDIRMFAYIKQQLEKEATIARLTAESEQMEAALKRAKQRLNDQREESARLTAEVERVTRERDEARDTVRELWDGIDDHWRTLPDNQIVIARAERITLDELALAAREKEGGCG